MPLLAQPRLVLVKPVSARRHRREGHERGRRAHGQLTTLAEINVRARVRRFALVRGVAAIASLAAATSGMVSSKSLRANDVRTSSFDA